MARQASRIAHMELKDYAAAIELYRYLILHAPDPQERREAQRSIAQILFENLQDYEAAVQAYENAQRNFGS
jgi:tetratricopeptide (TPR) repeat protein